MLDHMLSPAPCQAETINSYTVRSKFRDGVQAGLEGVVAKPKLSPYREQGGKPMWVKVKNLDYSQAEGRGELFERRR